MGLSSVSMEEDDRMPQPHATMGSYSLCMEDDDMEEDDIRRQYFGYEERLRSGSALGRILLVMVLLSALAALVVGAVKLLVWLVHLCGAIHVPFWLADFCDSPTTWVIDAWKSIEMPLLLVVGISLALLILLYGGFWVFGFVHYGIALGSYAAMWMSAIGNVVAGSLFSLLQMIAMGGIPVFTVLLCIVVCVALVVGAIEIFGWLVHSVALHTPTWLVDSWDSSTAWVLHVWDSVEIFGWWHSFVGWLHNLWNSSTAWLHNLWDSVEIFGWWHSFVAWLHNLWDSVEIFGWWHSFVAWLHSLWDSVEIFGWWHSFVAWLHSFWDSVEIFGWWHSFVAWLHSLWDSVEIFGWWHSFVAWLHSFWDSFEIFGWWHSFVAWLHHLWESITDHHKWKIYT